MHTKGAAETCHTAAQSHWGQAVGTIWWLGRRQHNRYHKQNLTQETDATGVSGLKSKKGTSAPSGRCRGTGEERASRLRCAHQAWGEAHSPLASLEGLCLVVLVPPGAGGGAAMGWTTAEARRKGDSASPLDLPRRTSEGSQGRRTQHRGPSVRGHLLPRPPTVASFWGHRPHFQQCYSFFYFSPRAPKCPATERLNSQPHGRGLAGSGKQDEAAAPSHSCSCQGRPSSVPRWLSGPAPEGQGLPALPSPLPQQVATLPLCLSSLHLADQLPTLTDLSGSSGRGLGPRNKSSISKTPSWPCSTIHKSQDAEMTQVSTEG